MATYKVPQDIEAEDKLIAWMTPRQTAYVGIVALTIAVWVMLANAGVWWLGLIFLPHIILLLILSGPFVHDQPSEVWLLAKIQFGLKPRRRIWDQSGLKELVSITAPKTEEKQLTNGLSQSEVKSRLQALAETIDTRGWAIKNLESSIYSQSNYGSEATMSDRLLSPSSFAQEVPLFDIPASADVLDEANSQTAMQMQRKLEQAARNHKEELLEKIQRPTTTSTAEPSGPWFTSVAAAQNEYSEEKAILESAKEQAKVPRSNLQTIDPKTGLLTKGGGPTANSRPTDEPEKAQVIAQLASNNDRSIESIAREANQDSDNLGEEEIIISLH